MAAPAAAEMAAAGAGKFVAPQSSARPDFPQHAPGAPWGGAHTCVQAMNNLRLAEKGCLVQTYAEAARDTAARSLRGLPLGGNSPTFDSVQVHCQLLRPGLVPTESCPRFPLPRRLMAGPPGRPQGKTDWRADVYALAKLRAEKHTQKEEPAVLRRNCAQMPDRPYSARSRAASNARAQGSGVRPASARESSRHRTQRYAPTHYGGGAIRPVARV
eukprot:TRINITY_DN41148_c0_g1_i1.p1 TRINITY_DN41148_c0_g1~~TRINITY_DN41148_c0_g1_i1.p1  ORF type:complete len:240 (+),score=31.76 TRINITY_DN41148_c0_g1_i1:77-721(+)